MKCLFLALSIILSTGAFASISCVGSIDVNSDSDPYHANIELSETMLTSDIYKASADLDNAYFSVTADLPINDLTLIISFGPEYTSGMISKGTFDANNNFYSAFVEKNKVYKIYCTKN